MIAIGPSSRHNSREKGSHGFCRDATSRPHGSAIYLPPDLNGYAERGSGTAGPALAALWIVIAGTVIYGERRRLFPASER